MGDLARCRTFPGESCLLPGLEADAGTCAVCSSVVSWANSHAQHILVREIKDGQGLYIFPVSRLELRPEDCDQCLVRFRIGQLSLREIRQTVNTYLLAAEESWIFVRDRCMRIR